MPILSTELKYFKSAFDVSLGGAITGTEIPTATLNNLWDDVTPAEASVGKTEYRCVYIKNTNAIIDLLDAVVFINTQSSSPDTIVAVGAGVSGVDGVEPNIADEIDSGNEFQSGGTLETVTFIDAIGEANGSSLTANLLADSTHIAFWMRRIVSPGSSAVAVDTTTIGVTGETIA